MNKNFKGEDYCVIGQELVKQLDEITDRLENRIKDNSCEVSDIINSDFNSKWSDKPNSPKHKNDHRGIYAFAQIINGNIAFMYIGISQKIRSRFWNHVTGNKRNNASWAYLMAKNDKRIKYILNNVEMTKDKKAKKNILNKAESLIPDVQIKHIYPCLFTFVQIDDNMLLHIAEVYCVNKLQSYWNTFETH